VASGQISAICKAPGDQSHPSVSDNYVVWMDNRTGRPDVYVYSLAQEVEVPLAAGPTENMYPDIFGEVIAWMAHDPLKQSWAIRTFDISIDNRSELVWGLSEPAAPYISDTYLAYPDLPIKTFGWRVHKKLLFGTESAPAIPPSGMNVRTGKDVVVYQDNSATIGSGNWNICVWMPEREPVKITDDTSDHLYPATDGSTVVWQDDREGNWDIYAYDLHTSKTEMITKNLADQTHPDVENGVIVWQDRRNGNWDVYSYDMETGKETAICKAPGDQTEPRIRTGKVVWTDNRSGNKDIYLYE
jgi:beta propeller repeat protein